MASPTLNAPTLEFREGIVDQTWRWRPQQRSWSTVVAETVELLGELYLHSTIPLSLEPLQDGLPVGPTSIQTLVPPFAPALLALEGSEQVPVRLGPVVGAPVRLPWFERWPLHGVKGRLDGRPAAVELQPAPDWYGEPSVWATVGLSGGSWSIVLLAIDEAQLQFGLAPIDYAPDLSAAPGLGPRARQALADFELRLASAGWVSPE